LKGWPWVQDGVLGSEAGCVLSLSSFVPKLSSQWVLPSCPATSVPCLCLSWGWKPLPPNPTLLFCPEITYPHAPYPFIFNVLPLTVHCSKVKLNVIDYCSLIICPLDQCFSNLPMHTNNNRSFVNADLIQQLRDGT
jgi:hypothetical protein